MSKRYDATGALTSWFENEYDTNDNLTKWITYSADGVELFYYEYEYDANNNVIKMSFTTDGELIFYQVYEYDDEGNRTGSTKYDKDGNVVE